jgi:hypothetical protein
MLLCPGNDDRLHDNGGEALGLRQLGLALFAKPSCRNPKRPSDASVFVSGVEF